MDKILTCENLNYYYQDGDIRRVILEDISYEFQRGKFYSILGESGSGKTTFLSLITALDSPRSGKIQYEGKDITEIGYENYRRNKIGIVFQSYNLINYMTAVENVLVAMDTTDNKLTNDIKATAYKLLEYVGIDKMKADRTVNKLSGGEQQRVAIARALSTDVDLIVADEPTGNLDEEKQAEVVEIFKELAYKHNKCVIIVTHSSDVAQNTDEIIKLKKGKFVNYV